jgi:hypothetical protein
MESTTKVSLRIIFHLSNQLNTTKVINNAVTSSTFVPPSPGKNGSRRKMGSILGDRGIGTHLAAKMGFTHQAALSIRLESAAFSSPGRESRGKPSRSSYASCHRNRNAQHHVQSKNGCEGSPYPQADLQTAIRHRNAQHDVQSRSCARSTRCRPVTSLETLVPCAKSTKAATVATKLI